MTSNSLDVLLGPDEPHATFRDAGPKLWSIDPPAPTGGESHDGLGLTADGPLADAPTERGRAIAAELARGTPGGARRRRAPTHRRPRAVRFLGGQSRRALRVTMGKGWVFDDNKTAGVFSITTQLVFSHDNGLLGDHPVLRGRDPSEEVRTVRSFTGQSLTVPEGNGAAEAQRLGA